MKNKLLLGTIILCLSGCRIVGGTVGGAIYMPIQEVKEYNKEKDDTLASKVLTPVISIGYGAVSVPIGAWEGFYWGLQAELYNYGEGKEPENYVWYKPWDRKEK